MSYEYVKTKNNNGIFRIILNSPPHNVLTIPMMEELISAFRWAGHEPGSLVVLEAEGKDFSVGVDVHYFLDKKVYNMYHVFQGMFEAINQLEKPIVAVVNGAALGGSFGIVLSCDLVVASETAKLGMPDIQLGLFPAFSCHILPRLLPWAKAMELLLMGEIFNADRAEQWGLVNKVLPKDGFVEGVDNFLRKLSVLSPVALSLTKKAAKNCLNIDFTGELMDKYNTYLHQLMESKDVLEGVQAFMDKRKPVFNINK